MHTEESLMALANAYADAWHRDESIVNPRLFKSPWKEEALRAAVQELEDENERFRKLLKDARELIEYECGTGRLLFAIDAAIAGEGK